MGECGPRMTPWTQQGKGSESAGKQRRFPSPWTLGGRKLLETKVPESTSGVCHTLVVLWNNQAQHFGDGTRLSVLGKEQDRGGTGPWSLGLRGSPSLLPALAVGGQVSSLIPGELPRSWGCRSSWCGLVGPLSLFPESSALHISSLLFSLVHPSPVFRRLSQHIMGTLLLMGPPWSRARHPGREGG